MTKFKWGWLLAVLLALLVLFVFVARSMFGSYGGETAADSPFIGETSEADAPLMQQERLPANSDESAPAGTAPPGDKGGGVADAS